MHTLPSLTQSTPGFAPRWTPNTPAAPYHPSNPEMVSPATRLQMMQMLQILEGMTALMASMMGAEGALSNALGMPGMSGAPGLPGGLGGLCIPGLDLSGYGAQAPGQQLFGAYNSPLPPGLQDCGPSRSAFPGSESNLPSQPPLSDTRGTTPSSGPLNIQGAIEAVPAANRNAARRHFPIIAAECQRQGVNDKAQVAYILATTVHESGAGAYMEEFASGRAYEGRRSLGNTQPGDGMRYKGRGYVQLTGRRNYQDWSRRLGVDLVSNPNAAKEPATAARILVQGMRDGTFTGKRLGDYVGNGRTDFHNARRVINGTDKADAIARLAQRIQASL